MLFLIRAKWRVLGLALLVLPFAIGAPENAGGLYAGLSPEVAVQLQDLASRFAVATAVASALQYLLLGALCAAAVARWLSPLLETAATAPATAEVSS
jgi:predicted cobalt transporter CbtA